MKKTVFFVFLFLSVLFSAATVNVVDTEKLYPVKHDDSNINIENTFGFTYTTTLSTNSEVLTPGVSANDLQEGTEICPGTITATSRINGEWADSSGSEPFKAYVLFPYANCEPDSESDVETNRPIRWNTNDYDDMTDTLACYRSSFDPNPSCWGRGGSLTRQSIRRYWFNEVYGFSHRVGWASTTCTGGNTIQVIRSGVTIDLWPDESTGNGKTTFSHSTDPLSIGSYTFRTSFDVDGCSILARTWECEGSKQAEYYYTRTSASGGTGAPEYGYRVTNSDLHIYVEDKEADLSITSTSPGSNIQMSPGGTVGIQFRTRNDGNVVVKATDTRVSPTPRFAVTKGSGFNQDINEGDTKTITVYLTAPPTLGQSENVQVCIQYDAEEPVCGGTGQDEEVCRSFTVGSATQECTSCIILSDPGGQSIVTLDTPQEVSFAIACLGTGGPMACSNTNWILTPALGTITSSDDLRATTDIDGGPTTGLLYANVNGQCECSARIDTTFYNNANCTMDPLDITVEEQTEQDFTARCRVNDVDVLDCPPDYDWDLTGGVGDILNSDRNAATVNISHEGVGFIIASYGGGVPGSFSCSGTIDASNLSEGNGDNGDDDRYGGDGCVIYPSTGYMHPSDEIKFQVWCYSDDTKTDVGRCRGIDRVQVTWNELTADAQGDFVYIQSSSVEGEGDFEVTTIDDDKCDAHVIVGEAICEDFI